jgi:hypothetical protein
MNASVKKFILLLVLLSVLPSFALAVLLPESQTFLEQMVVIGVFLIAGFAIMVFLVDLFIFLYNALKRKILINTYTIYILFSVILFICSEMFIRIKIGPDYWNESLSIQAVILITAAKMFLVGAFLDSVYTLRKKIYASKNEHKQIKEILLNVVRTFLVLIVCWTVWSMAQSHPFATYIY